MALADSERKMDCQQISLAARYYLVHNTRIKFVAGVARKHILLLITGLLPNQTAKSKCCTVPAPPDSLKNTPVLRITPFV